MPRQSSKKICMFLGFAALGILAANDDAQGMPLFTLEFGEGSISSNSPPTGASGSASFEFADDGGDVELTVVVTNTTGSTVFGEGATGSKLTGFAFDLLNGVSFISGTFSSSGFLDTLLTNVVLPPFTNGGLFSGTIDIAFADNTNFQGGGPAGALPEGQSATIQILLDTTLNAVDLGSAYQTAFETAFDVDPPSPASVMRFQAVEPGDRSDKLADPTVVPNEPPNPVPEPGMIALLGAGLLSVGGIAGLRRRLLTD